MYICREEHGSKYNKPNEMKEEERPGGKRGSSKKGEEGERREGENVNE